LIIAIGITALVGILTVVSALENTISSDFASMGTLLTSNNTKTQHRDKEKKEKKPHCFLH
jgi:putative ABC transport system permease protein